MAECVAYGELEGQQGMEGENVYEGVYETNSDEHMYNDLEYDYCM